MKAYIGNAFSINMLAGDSTLMVSDSSPDRIPVDAISCIGHQSTATVVSELLGRDVPMRRIAVSLDKGDELYAITLFTSDGKPYRAPEGVVLGADDLAALRLRIKRVRVVDDTDMSYNAQCEVCGRRWDNA